MALDLYHPVDGNEQLKKGRRGDLLYDFVQKGNGTWTTGKVSMRGLNEQLEPAPEVLIIFIPDVIGSVNLAVHAEIFERFKIPAAFRSDITRDASGYFGCQDTRDVNGNLESFSSHLRFQVKQPTDTSGKGGGLNATYVWHHLGIFSTWTAFKQVLVVCFGLPPSLKQSLLHPAQVHLNDPFSFHAVFTEHVLSFYDTSVWSWRDLVRDLEQNRTSSYNPQPDYVKMHEIARHIIHCSETLKIGLEVMKSLVQEHEILFQENPSFPPESITLSRQTRRMFRSHITLFNCLDLRSKALEKRLANETNLAFNTVAQYNSHIAVQIGAATRVDSAAMKTISILGLIFLPATFICALFSTSFFNFTPASDTEPQRWRVSEKFWIYWVIAIPVTLITVAFWVSWQKRYNRTS